MKKLVLLSLAATVITGSAFAASVPVTKSVIIPQKFKLIMRSINAYLIAVALTMMAMAYL